MPERRPEQHGQRRRRDQHVDGADRHHRAGRRVSGDSRARASPAPSASRASPWSRSSIPRSPRTRCRRRRRPTARRPGTCADQPLDAVDHLDREAGVEQHLAHQHEERDRRQREAHHRADAVARQLRQARLAAEPEPGAEQVDREERERDRQAEEEQARSSRRASSHAAPTQPITIRTSCRAHGVVARSDVGLRKTPHAKDEFDREQRKADRQRRQEPPLGHRPAS